MSEQIVVALIAAAGAVLAAIITAILTQSRHATVAKEDKKEGPRSAQRLLTRTSNVQELVLHGNILLNEEKYQEAQEAFEKAIKADENCAAAWFGKGEALCKTLGKDQQDILMKIARGEISVSEAEEVGEQSEICFRKAAKLEPRNNKYQFLISQFEQKHTAPVAAQPKLVADGNILMEEGKYQEALDAFEKAIKTDKNCAAAWHGKGMVLCKILGKDQQDVLMKITRGDIGMSEAQKVGDQAKICLRKAAELEPSNNLYQYLVSEYC